MAAIKERVFTPNLLSVTGGQYTMNVDIVAQYDLARLSENGLNQSSIEGLLMMLEQRQNRPVGGSNIGAFIHEEELVLMEKILEKAGASQPPVKINDLQRVLRCLVEYAMEPLTGHPPGAMNKNMLKVLDTFISEHSDLAKDVDVQKKFLSLNSDFYSTPASASFLIDEKVTAFCGQMQALKTTYSSLEKRYEELSQKITARIKVIPGYTSYRFASDEIKAQVQVLTEPIKELQTNKEAIDRMIRKIGNDPLNEENDKKNN